MFEFHILNSKSLFLLCCRKTYTKEKVLYQRKSQLSLWLLWSVDSNCEYDAIIGCCNMAMPPTKQNELNWSAFWWKSPLHQKRTKTLLYLWLPQKWSKPLPAKKRKENGGQGENKRQKKQVVSLYYSFSLWSPFCAMASAFLTNPRAKNNLLIKTNLNHKKTIHFAL